jgi:hypothetical protein
LFSCKKKKKKDEKDKENEQQQTRIFADANKLSDVRMTDLLQQTNLSLHPVAFSLILIVFLFLQKNKNKTSLSTHLEQRHRFHSY